MNSRVVRLIRPCCYAEVIAGHLPHALPTLRIYVAYVCPRSTSDGEWDTDCLGVGMSKNNTRSGDEAEFKSRSHCGVRNLGMRFHVHMTTITWWYDPLSQMPC